MKRSSILHLALAATLALLLPLQQLHCICMQLPRQAVPVSAGPQAGHECCESTAQCGTEDHSRPGRTPHTCTCVQIVAVTLPTVFVASVESPTMAPLAVLAVPAGITLVSIVTETAAMLDVGSPPLPADPGAHGLRAPPVST